MIAFFVGVFGNIISSCKRQGIHLIGLWKWKTICFLEIAIWWKIWRKPLNLCVSENEYIFQIRILMGKTMRICLNWVVRQTRAVGPRSTPASPGVHRGLPRCRAHKLWLWIPDDICVSNIKPRRRRRSASWRRNMFPTDHRHRCGGLPPRCPAI